MNADTIAANIAIDDRLRTALAKYFETRAQGRGIRDRFPVAFHEAEDKLLRAVTSATPTGAGSFRCHSYDTNRTDVIGTMPVIRSIELFEAIARRIESEGA